VADARHARRPARNARRCDEERSFNLIDSQCSFPVDELLVQPFTVPHDAREPVQYVLSDGASRLVS